MTVSKAFCCHVRNQLAVSKAFCCHGRNQLTAKSLSHPKGRNHLAAKKFIPAQMGSNYNLENDQFSIVLTVSLMYYFH